ncbi:uncharacterized protein LOC131856883 [Cryptomeria japonica]|uniref:uncharacterized protein LOC131856883 n=1 Tax=Cryptomeria japonica TaxID=3369 RepID=UPI0027DA582A|nr:uncharacterized protein LOC131856883 [Cryptomeria japonica]
MSDVAANIKERKSNQQPVTHVSPVVTSSETDSDKAVEFKRVDRKKRKSPLVPSPAPSPKQIGTLRKKEWVVKEPSGPKKKIEWKELTPKTSDTLSPTELVKKINQDGNLSNVTKSRQEIDELIAEDNINVFVSGHQKVYQKGDKGKNKVGSVPDLNIKHNLPPPAQDTPPAVAEAQAEVQNQPIEKTLEEEKATDAVFPDSNILFTMKKSEEEKKDNAEPSTSPSSSILDFRPTSVIEVLLDSINKLMDCNALEFKTIDDSLPILQMIALEYKVDHIIGTIGKLDTLSKFISANIQSLDTINEKTTEEKVHKEKEVFFRKRIKECTQQIDTLLPTLNSSNLEYKELYWEVCKPHQLIEDIDDHIRKTQKEIDDIADDIIGSSELTSVIEQEMATHEEKIENLEKEKARLKMKARELKNKLGPRLDNLITHRNALSKARIQGDRTPEQKMHHLTRMIRQIETIIIDNTKFMQGLNLVLADIFQIVHNRL